LTALAMPNTRLANQREFTAVVSVIVVELNERGSIVAVASSKVVTVDKVSRFRASCLEAKPIDGTSTCCPYGSQGLPTILELPLDHPIAAQRHTEIVFPFFLDVFSLASFSLPRSTLRLS
jgi:hypothetical protein